MNNQSIRTSAQSTPGFIFYQSYYEALSGLKPRQRHAILDAILEYAFTGVKPELPATFGAILAVILPTVASCQKRYKGAAERSKKVEDTISDDGQENPEENHEENKASCENKSKTKNAKVCAERIIEKEKKKDKEKENEMDMEKGVYSEKEKEKETEAASKSASETASPSGGNTHAPQRELCSEIISDYAGVDSELRSLLESWLDIKRQRSQPITPESIRLNLEELTRITAGGDKKAYLREVIRRGWGTFFELEKKPSRQDGDGDGRDGRSCKSGKGGSGSQSGRNRGNDWGDGYESNFDMDEFDRFTLGT